MALRLSIVTPERPVVDVEVESVVVPGREGEFGALPAHEPLLAPIGPGVVEYRAEGAAHRVAISGGFAEVTQERLTLLARTAELADEIDAERAQQAHARAEEARLDLDAVGDAEELAQVEAQAARASARLRTGS